MNLHSFSLRAPTLRSITLALTLAPAVAFAQASPEETAPAPAATPLLDATTTIPAPAAVPGALVERIPDLSPAPVRSKGWGVELALVHQGVFDPGIHLFSRTSFISGAELRGTRQLGASESPLKVMPEIAYSLSRAQVGLAGAGSGDLILQRASAGIRVSVTAPGRWGFGAYTRVGGTALHATALVHDPYRDHRDEALTAGGYAGGGVEVDAGSSRRAARRVMFAAEAGHLATPGFAFPRMGHLDVNGVYGSGSATVRF